MRLKSACYCNVAISMDEVIMLIHVAGLGGTHTLWLDEK